MDVDAWHPDRAGIGYTRDGNWWQVMTRDGKVGYMHVSRIKIVAPR
ncbi:hypothetical protein [Malikia granosa]|nr:hypothetical protein [Malikia granosa]